ncbi:hypothetical protein SLEP1_g44391 [Rubroshorea leprosula]|uniref:Retrotransposon gag domain-containing protein n=1 Tax=Rubroshorea leprosula TaxID=152421 RepID=A0AAV5LGI9_9ROSI|nr:hypothetical protein SLEP1_g44391 [Rubroshorea leprosula]
MADEANLEKVALENRVENMENTLKELMASFQSLQATLVTRAPLTTNPLFEGNVSVANLPIAISTLGKEPMSSCPPNPTISGTSGIKPFDLNAGVATAQSNDQEETRVDKSITEDEDKAIKAKVQLMEETIKSMQGVQTNKLVNISSLCFFPNIQLLHQFKLPEFDKYNGTGCPYAHLTILTGPVDAWFFTLDKSKVKSWHELSYNFMKQYEYNTSLAPSKEDLQRAEKKRSENFKEFVQRWHGLAAQVQPPLTNHELKQVEDGIKSRIIMDYQAMKSLLEQYQNGSLGASSSKKVGQNQKKEDENGSISSVYEAYGRNKQSHGQFDMFRKLVAAGIVTLVPMVPLNPPFPTWYNSQARCEYHSGGVGHDLENCLALKHRLQDLIEAKELQITSKPELVGLNITKNPLPTHDGSTINMIEKDFEEGQEVATVTLTNQVSSTPR